MNRFLLFGFVSKLTKHAFFVGTRWIAHKIRALEMIIYKSGMYMQHRDVILNDFENSKANVSTKKNEWLSLISKAIQSRLGRNDNSAPSKYGVMIINTECWLQSENDVDFGLEAISSLFQFYETPLTPKWQKLH